MIGSLRAVSVAIFLLLEASPLLAHHPAHEVSSATWNLRPDVLSLLLIFAAVYARGWFKLRRRSSHVAQPWQLGAYLFGLGAIGIALLSPIDALASKLLSMHMAQHLLLLMIAPLSFLLANPLAAFLWGLPANIRRRAGSLLTRGSLFRRSLWALTLMPVTWSLYVVNLWVWHHPRLYQAALANEWTHDLEHLLFFFTAFLFWWPIVNPAPHVHGVISYAYRVIYLIAATLQNTLLGMAISFPDKLLYPLYGTALRSHGLSPINDQALGGGIMWVSGHMYLIPILVLIARALFYQEQSLDRRFR